MKPFAFFIIVFFVATNCYAQINISGKVIDSATAKPVPYVSILVANTTIGTKTDENGAFHLSNLPSNTTLIASSVGYKARQAVVTAENSAAVTFIMAQRSTVLKEVTINAGDWQRNLTMFKNEFIGTNNSKDVAVLNPDILNLRFDHDANRLLVSTDEFLEIQNNNLGYKLRFLVKEFWADYNSGKTHYSGQVVFELMKGKASDERRWAKNREYAYSGSFRHFLAILYTGNLEANTFWAYQFIHKSNSKRPPQKLIDSKLAYFRKQIDERVGNSPGDSLRKWVNLRNLPAATDSLGREFVASQLTVPQVNGNMQLDFAGQLYIIYGKKRVDEDLDNLHRFPRATDHEIAAVTIKNPAVPIVFNKDGILLTRENLFFEGAWDSRIMDMLPSDYKP